MGDRSRVALASAAAALALLAAPGAATAAGPTVSAVRCPTTFGISQHATWPTRVRVLHSPASVRGLAAYSNSQIVLVGPAGMRCSGIVATDGGSQLVLWPQGEPKPGEHSRGAGLTLTLDPACAGCQADDACPFFTAFARKLGFPCRTAVPAGEHVDDVSSSLVLFEDPPGVAGSGWPSGGSDPANGVVGIHTSGGNSAVYRSTCTLPASQKAACTVSLNDAISRYG